MKIAIAGTGISGLVAAHLLHREHDVTVFEADSRIGGHTHTFDVEVEGEHHAVDTGFIVFNTKTYPNFVKLLDRIGVESAPTDMSFGLACERSGLEWGSRGLGSLFAQRRNVLNPAFWRMLRDVVRFNREARALLGEETEKVTLGDYLCGGGYSEEFVHQYLLPMGAAIWSANPRTFLEFPATSFVRFFENHGLLETPPRLPWRVVRGGSSRYLDPLTAAFRDRIRISEPLRGVRRRGHFVEVITSSGIERFDHVILAMHSDQALRVLLDASGLERSILGSIRYQPNEVVLHRDTSLMPGNSRAWSSWNYRIPAEEGSSAIVTYDMNRLQNIQSRHRFFVTLNASDRIDPSLIHAEFRYDHPVFDEAAIQAQRRHADISGRNRVHFCGAYWGYGFHEDGVASALQVCRSFGLEL